MKFRDIFGAEEAGIRRYSNDDKPKRAEIAPFERVRITLVTLTVYFRLVDAALAGNISDALLLFDEILSKGFDAGHFVTGFTSHLRDVLVSKDAATVQLLEVSASAGP